MVELLCHIATHRRVDILLLLLLDIQKRSSAALPHTTGNLYSYCSTYCIGKPFCSTTTRNRQGILLWCSMSYGRAPLQYYHTQQVRYILWYSMSCRGASQQYCHTQQGRFSAIGAPSRIEELFCRTTTHNRQVILLLVLLVVELLCRIETHIRVDIPLLVFLVI